jgi:hypothetical protein
VLRIHPPPYQGRLPPSPSSSCIRQGLIHAVAYKAQSVDSSPTHNTSRPFHVHPPFVRSSSFQEVVAYPQASHPRSTSLHSSTRYPIRITNNTVKILLHPFIHPSIHPSAQVHHPDVCFKNKSPRKDISFSVPSNTHPCASASHSHHLKQAQGPSGFRLEDHRVPFRSVPFSSFVKYTSRVPHSHPASASASASVPSFLQGQRNQCKQASKRIFLSPHLNTPCRGISIAHRLDSVLLRFPFGGFKLGCSVWMTG